MTMSGKMKGMFVQKAVLLAVLALSLTACGARTNEAGSGTADGGVESRHEAPIPSEYAGKTNPIPADQASLERGKSLYTTNCASCHGDTGIGDGPASSALNPPPAPIAHSSQGMADDYLFWRISEGGVPFDTSMPSWKSMDEQSRWDLVNYIRSLAE
jgi:mono/diheme cytochrome c family protein